MRHTENKNVTGRLENWRKDSFGRSVIWGEIHDDVHYRWRSGTIIHTSHIDGLYDMELAEGDVVSTLNSSYLLGKELKDY